MIVDRARADHAIRLGLLSFILVVGHFGVVQPLGLTKAIQWHAQDQLLRWRHQWQSTSPAANDLVLVKIDDHSLQRIGEQWPWDRGIFARLTDAIGAQHPRMIVMDFAFVGSSTPDSDNDLIEALRRHQPVYLASYIDPVGNYVVSDEQFQTPGVISGLINKPRDRDHVVRRFWPAIDLPGGAVEPEYALEIKIAADLFGADLRQTLLSNEALVLRDRTGKTIRRTPLVNRTLLINPLATQRDLESVSAIDVLDGRIPADQLTGKVVFVGTTTEITHDIYATPIGLMPGAMLSINSLLTLASERYLIPVPLPILLLGCLVIAVGASFSAFYWPLLASCSTTLLLIALSAGGCIWATFLDRVVDWLGPVAIGGSAWIAGLMYRHFVLVIANARLRTHVTTDIVSGALTARQGRLRIRLAYETAVRTRQPASLILLEPCEPSRQQDRQREDAGMLKAVATTILSSLPAQGSAARLTDNRFSVIIPRLPAVEGSGWFGRLKPAEGSPPLAAGIADTGFNGIRSSQDWLACAEAALQQARQSTPPVATFDPARDQVVLGQPEDSSDVASSDPFTELVNDLEERNRELERALAELRTTHQETQEALVTTAKVLVRALETKDPYTAGHSERVSGYAARLAKRLKLPADQVEEIQEAGLLHDIGKIGLPEEVLHKVGELSEHERHTLRLHHAEGSRILEPLKHFKHIIPLIYYHHERYDGKGFPHGLVGDLIPIGAQVIAVVDAFDAMTTHRGYNVPMTLEQSVAELRRSAGTQFNPRFVETFAQMIQDEGTKIADRG